MTKRHHLFVTVTLFFLACSFIAAQNINPTVYKKARIHYADATKFEKLLNSGIAIDHGIHRSKKYVESVFSSEEIATAKRTWI